MEQTKYLRAWKTLQHFQGNFGFTYGNKVCIIVEKKKKKSGWKEEEVGVEIKGPGECSSPSKGQEVSGSWQPRPDEEPGWRHSKPGRAHGADGNEERERHSPPKTVTPG